MFTNQSTDISLQAPCRALDAVRGERVDNLWVAATCSFRGTGSNNSLTVLQFHADVNELSTAASLEMEGPTRCVACSPTDSALVLTAPEQGPSVTLWKLPSFQTFDGDDRDAHDTSYLSSSNRSFHAEENENPQAMAMLLPEGGFGANIVDIAWRDPSEDTGPALGDVLTIDTNGHLTQWDMEACIQVHSVETVVDGSHNGLPPPRVAWDPHANGQAVAVTTTKTVSILDWRVDTSVPTGMCAHIAVASAHFRGVTDIDYNPNKPYVLATAGYDGTAKVWDLRQAKQPVMTARGGHSHWVSRVSYNPCHDQLVLTTGTDCVANLWRLSTCSSAPLLQDPGADGGGSETAAPNVRVAQHTQHGDSIYAAAWGAADSWMYLTVSFDGKAVLHHVPSKEKYKILL